MIEEIIEEKPKITVFILQVEDAIIPFKTRSDSFKVCTMLDKQDTDLTLEEFTKLHGFDKDEYISAYTDVQFIKDGEHIEFAEFKAYENNEHWIEYTNNGVPALYIQRHEQLFIDAKKFIAHNPQIFSAVAPTNCKDYEPTVSNWTDNGNHLSLPDYKNRDMFIFGYKEKLKDGFFDPVINWEPVNDWYYLKYRGVHLYILHAKPQALLVYCDLEPLFTIACTGYAQGEY